jgi:NDP-sugar pyrophosphorylase family protein
MHKNFTPDLFFDLSTFKHAELFANSHVWDALKKLAAYLAAQPLGKIEIEIPPGVHLEFPEKISIGKGTKIEPGAFIRGPCIIGKDCSIRHGAYIRGDFLTGDHCVVGHATEVKSAIFLNNAHAAHFAYVGDSILGNRVNLGAGTKCANLKLDNTEVVLRTHEGPVSTGLRKFGAIIGDDCQLGCNSVTNPGTILGKGVFCYPCLNIGGVIPGQQMIKSNEKLISRNLSKK